MDKRTFELYQLFPADRLGWAVRGFVSVTSATGPESLYAHLHMTDSGDCPFFEADRLCGIQKAYGAELLSSSCSSYPRALNRVDGLLEGSLSLSCPEAARNVLLDAGFLDRITDMEAGGFRTDNFFWLGDPAKSTVRKPFGAFHAVRGAMIELIRDRSRPVWLRLLRMGALCRQLEEQDDAELAIAKVLGSENDGELVDGELMGLEGNRRLRLGVTMRLTDERMRDSRSGRRFQEVYWAFLEGIAAGAGVGGRDDLAGLRLAEETYYRPFMEAHPQVLENWLVNHVYQRLFPFGRSGGAAVPERGMFEEFVLLATQFGWLEMLLMGAAGRYQEKFDGARVVEVVQSFHRAVEHYGAVIEGLLAMMKDRGMHDLAGMAVMVR